ncbi:MAG TPA: hypothetical protein VN764_14005, partial [Polyangiaceae bacterium]|nr:hypothetical protein [Polyangiaceae bacterium]
LSATLLFLMPACGPSSSGDQPLAATRAERSSAPTAPDALVGLGGSVSGLALDCAATRPPEGGNCTPTDPTSSCQSCVAARCCTEQAACNALQPMNSCAFGSTLFEGSAVSGGEIACVMECLAQRSSSGVLLGQPSDVVQCAGQCASSECGGERASDLTRDLALCIVGDSSQSEPGCRAECGLLP